MKITFPVIAFLILVCTHLEAQTAHQNFWLFGANAGLDFSSGSPVPFSANSILSIQGSAAMSDRDGNLLFYTDGTTVWNKQHQPMPNGTDLAGGLSSQSALIVPKPCSNNFYIFTTTGVYGSHNLCFSEVDPSLNGGLGDVTSAKNTVLADSVGQKITAIRPEGESDIWAICRQTHSNRFLSYRVTSGGIIPFPVVSHAGSVIDAFGMGNMKISPKGDLLVSMNSDVANEFTADLLRFNIYTGVVSTLCAIPLPFTHPYGAEFSLSGSRLYISSWQDNPIWQYDVTLPDTMAIFASGTPTGPVPLNHHYGALQRGPDGKIYFPNMDLPFLGCISDPEQPAATCGFQENAVTLEAAIGYIGLPNFMEGNAFKPCPEAIPNVITPNGDGANDLLTIPNVAPGEGSLTVYNRWGTPVFSSEKYMNDWDGKGLTEGVYFYVYRYFPYNEVFTGNVEIIR